MHSISTAGLFVCALLLPAIRYAEGAPAPVAANVAAASLVSAAASPSPTVPFASPNPNGILWTEDSDVVPSAVRGSLGASVLGPQNVPLDLQNADFLAPPSTDSGTV